MKKFIQTLMATYTLIQWKYQYWRLIIQSTNRTEDYLKKKIVDDALWWGGPCYKILKYIYNKYHQNTYSFVMILSEQLTNSSIRVSGSTKSEICLIGKLIYYLKVQREDRETWGDGWLKSSILLSICINIQHIDFNYMLGL